MSSAAAGALAIDPDIRSRRRSAPRARMADVAREAGVSAITVSRALNAPGKLAPATLRAVREAIGRLGYVPDLTAGSLASNRSRIVGVIVPTIANSIFAETVGGLAAALASRHYQLLLGQTGYRVDEEAALVAAFLGRRVDGLVLTGVTHARGVRGRLRQAGVPVVETWDLPARPIDMAVGFSNLDAGRAAARYLVARGRRRLAFVGGSDDRSAKRLAGLEDGAREACLPDVKVRAILTASSPAEGAAAFADLCAGDRRPDAVFCSNDTLAAGILFECARRRVAVPRDVAVMGFADLPIASAIEPRLTSIQVHAAEMGARAAAMLLGRLDGTPPADRVADLGFEIVERAST